MFLMAKFSVVYVYRGRKKGIKILKNVHARVYILIKLEKEYNMEIYVLHIPDEIKSRESPIANGRNRTN